MYDDKDCTYTLKTKLTHDLEKRKANGKILIVTWGWDYKMIFIF